MKVLHIIPTLSKGGAEKVVVDLLNKSYENGVIIKLLLFYPSDTKLRIFELNNKIEVLYISNRKSNFFLLLIKSVFWMIKNWNFLMCQDILHAHLTISSIFISILGLFAGITFSKRPRLVETNHSIGIPIKKWNHNLFLFMSRYRDAYVLIGYDSYWVSVIEKMENVVLRIIPNGVEIINRVVDRNDSNNYLTKIGIFDPNPIVIGTVSRIVQERSPLKIVEIFHSVHSKLQKNNNVHFVFGGEGKLFNKINEKVTELNMNNYIHLPGLIVDPTLARSVMTIYLSINIGAVTGIAGIEAAIEGKPVISLQMDRSYVNSKADWIWSDSDTGKVADKIVELVYDEKLRFKISRYQYDYARQNLNSSIMAKKYEELYFYLLNK